MLKNKTGYIQILIIIGCVVALVFFAMNAKALIDIYREDETDKQQCIGLLEHVEANGFKGVPVIIVSNDTAIEYVSEKFINSNKGFYHEGTDTIYVRDGYFYSCDALICHLFHEYGHHFWFKVMDESERQEYTEIYRKTNWFVSEYAIEGGAYEDFAETFEAYMTRSAEIPVKKANFMHRMKQKYPAEVQTHQIPA